MSNTNIKLDPYVYSEIVREIEAANANLLITSSKPELTGCMPSMMKTIKTFEKISFSIMKCNAMVHSLDRNLVSAAEIIKKQDRSLAGEK